MTASAQRIHCPARQTRVDVMQGFEKCMMDHQCFSDDPCPLAEHFEASALKGVHVAVLDALPACGHTASPDRTR